jgi:hypothetical protein
LQAGAFFLPRYTVPVVGSETQSSRLSHCSQEGNNRAEGWFCVYLQQNTSICVWDLMTGVPFLLHPSPGNSWLLNKEIWERFEGKKAPCLQSQNGNGLAFKNRAEAIGWLD